jgi:pyruvate kinase
MSSTKIVATIGPATATLKGILGLAEAGMNIARLNGSHADLDWHADTIALIRETVPHVPILLDIPGKKIRTIQLAHEPKFKAGDEIILTTNTSFDGSEKVPVNNPRLHQSLEAGATIFADDGTLQFTVIGVTGRDIRCRAENDGQLRSRKGINVPFVKLAAELVTDRDREMVAFARAKEVDYIGISFVESAHHVRAIRELTGGNWPRIVAKIENQGGLDNMDEVLEATDAAMIDRGDLSVETNLENVSIFQKSIINRARHYGCPVIVATEILHTMIENPFPTKAEVSDISNAVLDGCAATMLSGETAVGAHPAEAVRVMHKVVTAAEHYEQGVLDEDSENSPLNRDHAMEDAAALICRSLPVTKIVAVTLTGYAARMLAARRPRQPIIAVSSDLMAVRSFNLLQGTEGFHVDIPFSITSTDHIAHCLEACWRAGKIDDDDLIFVTGVGYPRPGNTMNLLQTHYVSDLVVSMGWSR